MICSYVDSLVSWWEIKLFEFVWILNRDTMVDWNFSCLQHSYFLIQLCGRKTTIKLFSLLISVLLPISIKLQFAVGHYSPTFVKRFLRWTEFPKTGSLRRLSEISTCSSFSASQSLYRIDQQNVSREPYGDDCLRIDLMSPASRLQGRLLKQQSQLCFFDWATLLFPASRLRVSWENLEYARQLLKLCNAIVLHDFLGFVYHLHLFIRCSHW